MSDVFMDRRISAFGHEDRLRLQNDKDGNLRNQIVKKRGKQ
jgi:hypothetical protein